MYHELLHHNPPSMSFLPNTTYYTNMWRLAVLLSQHGSVNHKRLTVESEAGLPSGLLMHINPHLNALTAGFQTGQHQADGGSEGMF